jgi:hypothetical protein
MAFCRTCTAFLVLSCGLTAHAQEARHEIGVRLGDGRTVRGTVHDDTNHEDLWLRFTVDQSEALRRIAWARVQTVEYAGQIYPAAEFRTLAEGLSAKNPLAGRAEPLALFFQPPPSAQPVRPPPPPVRQLRINAWIDSWDADAQADGLIVELLPLAEDGTLRPVTGTVEIILLGQLRFGRAEPWGQLGRWSQVVRLEDFGPLGALYRLPFPLASVPVCDEFSHRGLVEARLVVPGEGAFAAPLIRIGL